MKARKRLTHSELMTELFAQVRFPVEVSEVVIICLLRISSKQCHFDRPATLRKG